MGIEQTTNTDVATQLGALIRSEPLPMIQKSIDAFGPDLPVLLKIHRVAAYHGDDRIAFGRTEAELYQECFDRGLSRDDFIVGYVGPHC